ncbi:hypothetical protein BU24DRAFT_418815 [Aaosphaeria arxii CBS 175.79]|uniref:RNA polymerase II subunit B1 CTD phosphatase RPAP2 homolog n=1 Tax=Aaosphaeria arxii CBS 175.79 TaxID=1450172 RepID=A0A6A5Y1Y1_9PLEO|nr:uncharacterized protein BU24DRAFT_418815 [Aaosphaeria arxii CBS 175.79]KAF2019229.1 hypothetical protein BU24DRAFT_418815 [Aaosphaeria arxii CBS 175.79]
MPPNPILNNSTVSTNAPPETKAVNQRHLNVALQHANIIEQRKKVEAQVLESIIALMDFPNSPDADPKRPSASDATLFREHLVLFQPSDYDSLIEERNIADKCGYTLCPRPKKKTRSGAKKQFVDTERGVEIVDKKVLEVWCSEDCAKRALYVKVQLNEEPAWTRPESYGEKIELMVENPEEHHKVLPLRLKSENLTPTPTKPSEEDEIAAAWLARDDALADLAIERGEKPGRLSKASKDLMTANIKERVASATPPVAPSLDDQPSQAHMAIEGHVPRENRRDQQLDEEDDTEDWDRHLPG